MEILGHIASYIRYLTAVSLEMLSFNRQKPQLYRPSQLNNLCRTCECFKSVIEPRLYEDNSIVLSWYWSFALFLEQLLEGGCESLKYIHSLTVCMQNDGLGAPSIPYDIYNDILCLDPDGDLEDGRDVRGHVYFRPRVLKTLMRLVINNIPVEQLEMFR